MPIRQTIIGTSLALAVVVSGAGARAETPWPLKTPAELKVLHGPTFVGMQILTYRYSADPMAPGTPSEFVIGIGRDIMFRDMGGRRQVIDLRLGRIYQIDENKNYTNSPFAAQIIWRSQEYSNRAMLAKVLAAGSQQGSNLEQKSTLASFDPFWIAMDLTVADPKEAPPIVEKRENAGEAIYLYHGVEAIRWRPMAEELPDNVRGNLWRAFLWFFRGHPSLTKEMATQGKAPQHLVLNWRFADRLYKNEFQLISSRWCGDCEALPADATPGLKMGGVFETDMAPVMIAASQGKYTTTSSEEYLNRVAASLDRADGLEAWLWFAERLLQYGVRQCDPQERSTYCYVQARMFSFMRANPDLQAFYKNTQKRSVEASNEIAALRPKVSANVYFLDLTVLNTLPPSVFSFKTSEQEPLKSAEPRLAAALAAMPVVPAVYRDIGSIYFAAVNPWRAWMVWEMGMSISGGSAEPNIWNHVPNLEAQARQRHPEFF